MQHYMTTGRLQKFNIWFATVILSMTHLAAFVDRFVMSLVLTPMKQALKLTDTELGLLSGSAFAIFYGLAAVPLGKLADSRGRRTVIVFSLLFWSAAEVASGLAANFGQAFAARLALGLGEAALAPAALSLLGDYFGPAYLGRVISIFTAGSTLGKSVALLAGGALLAALVAQGGLILPHGQYLAPWRGVFVLIALPNLLLALALMAIRAPQTKPALVASGAEGPLHWVSTNRRTFAFYVSAMICPILLIQAFAAWTPSFYVRYFAMTPAQSGFFVGMVVIIASPAGHLIGGFLSDRLRRRGVSPAVLIAAALVLSMPSALVFCLSRDPIVSRIALGALTLVLGVSAPAGLAGLQAISPDRLRGRINGLYFSTVTLIGVGLGPATIGVLNDQVFGGANGLVSSLLLLSVIVAPLGVAAAVFSLKPWRQTEARVFEAQVKMDYA